MFLLSWFIFSLYKPPCPQGTMKDEKNTQDTQILVISLVFNFEPGTMNPELSYKLILKYLQNNPLNQIEFHQWQNVLVDLRFEYSLKKG